MNEPLLPQVRASLKRFSKQGLLSSFYLAGGTALAIQYGHRFSQVLDFFSYESFSPLRVMTHLGKMGQFRLHKQEEGTVVGELEGGRVSFLHHPYKPLKPFLRYRSMDLASPLDIGVMKIQAIATRGSRRDFVDLYFICEKETTLKGLFRLHEKKYGESLTPRYHLLKSLAYFKDAEGEPMINLRHRVSWKTIRAFFEKEVALLFKSWT